MDGDLPDLIRPAVSPESLGHKLDPVTGKLNV